MFYFGGMTLGYLEPPEPAARPQDGGNEARDGRNVERSGAAEKIPALRDLIARANWFNLYW